LSYGRRRGDACTGDAAGGNGAARHADHRGWKDGCANRMIFEQRRPATTPAGAPLAPTEA
jgi:hypothetical protein